MRSQKGTAINPFSARDQLPSVPNAAEYLKSGANHQSQRKSRYIRPSSSDMRNNSAGSRRRSRRVSVGATARPPKPLEIWSRRSPSSGIPGAWGMTVEIAGRLNAPLGETAYPNRLQGVWGKMVAGEGLPTKSKNSPASSIISDASATPVSCAGDTKLPGEAQDCRFTATWRGHCAFSPSPPARPVQTRRGQENGA